MFSIRTAVPSPITGTEEGQKTLKDNIINYYYYYNYLMLITSNENCEGHHNLTHIFALGVHIAEHHLQTNQGIDWDSAECVSNLQYGLPSTNHSGKLVY